LCPRLVGPIHDKWARGIFSASHRGIHGGLLKNLMDFMS